MAGEIRLRVRYRELIGDWFDYLMVSQTEMQEIVEGTGWRVAEFHGSEGGQYVGSYRKKKVEQRSGQLAARNLKLG